jgi:hypothetical protein
MKWGNSLWQHTYRGWLYKQLFSSAAWHDNSVQNVQQEGVRHSGSAQVMGAHL